MMTDARTLALIDDLRKLPAETAWVEFKENNSDAEMIGRLISALANAARLADQHFAYIVWGIRDGDHVVTGTDFEPTREKHKKQPMELWLTQYLQPRINFSFKPLDYQGQRLILLEIPAAETHPIEFDRTAHIRIGSTTHRLSDHPERLRALWAKLQPYAWETGIAAQFLSGDDVLARLDHTPYFNLTGQPLPDNRQGIFEKLTADRLISQDVGGHWNITNLGAILFAKNLNDFSPSMARKAVRFVAYDGTNRAATVTHRQEITAGYASGFEKLVTYIDNLLPHNEYIGRIFREERSLYPAIAIRELVANALIHQDMTITGTGPLIEMFKDRLEITNPGQPLVNPERFLDSPPRSRNEALASLMRRMRLCEEQGTGIDKVIVAIEMHQLPPPDFRAEGDAVRVVMFAPRRFAQMTPDERVRACYQHAALKYVSGERMKNATLCERFGIDSQNAAQASTVIRQALDKNQIKPADPNHPRAGYVPYWA
jgi:predicted HTH transcriptional regulator